MRVISFLTLLTAVLLSPSSGAAAGTPDEAKKTVIVGGDFNYPPYEFLDENGEPRGFNVDLTRAIARTKGVKVKIRLGPWGRIREDLEQGRIDMVNGMFYSPERDKSADFSQPHAMVVHTAFARKGRAGFAAPEDLRGKRIAVMRGDIMHDYAVEHGLGHDIVTVESQEQALRLVSAGQADYALTAKLPGLYWIEELGISNVTATGPDLKVMEYCYAVPEDGDAELLSEFSEGIAILQKSGEYRNLVRKWFGAAGLRGISRKLLSLYAAGLLGLLLAVVAVVYLWSRTMRRKVEEKTRRLGMERLRLSAVVENFPNGSLFVVDEDLRFRLAGGEGITRFGPDPEAILDRTVREVFPGEAADRIEPMYRAAVLGERRTAEIHLDGEVYEFRTMPFWDYEADRPAALGMTQLVTEKKRLVQAMADRELRWRVMWNTIQAGLVVIDRESREILEVNSTGAAMIGLEREEVVGRPCYEFVCPNHRENCPLRDQDAPHLENAERAMVNSEGVRIPILKSVAAFHYEGRECLIESFLDISELKNAQELLETQTAKLTALVDSMPEFIIYKDLAGAYMGCNMSFTTLTGLGLDDVAGRFDHDLFPEELMEFFVHKDEEVLNRGKSASYERTLELPDAGRRRVEMTKLPYYRDDGQQIGLIGVARDVTDRHNLEVLKEDVDHIMRHDLRSPLNGIKGIVGVMLAEADMKPDEAREWLKLLDDEAGRMNRLIDTSLSLMKMEQGSYVYEPRPVDVIEILSKLERELDGLLKSREVGLSVRVNGDSANGRRFDIMGDEVLSHSMLSNLVRNAVEASPRGRTVSVDAWLEDRARIMVRNEGAVPEEVRERFFEKFATAGKKNGTGLGTYSVKLIAESFGGRVAMSTSEASGTTITLELEPGEGLGAEPGASRLSAAG